MAVLMATGHAVHIPHSIFDSVRTLTANIAAELGEAPANSDHYRVLFLIGVLLFLMTFVVNLTADLIVRGIRRKMMFTETPLVRRKLRQETIAKWVFFGMAASMIIPLMLIVGYLVAAGLAVPQPEFSD